ncbi:hypothetical protein KSP40_PGU015097 [Platanthera guangdongensis]|uniref:Uncharacterized protein n=1 Tax=Platanthera guangdongensis TaxID=2320717 RepID=A0ABR2MIC3_9ASPA
MQRYQAPLLDAQPTSVHQCSRTRRQPDLPYFPFPSPGAVERDGSRGRDIRKRRGGGLPRSLLSPPISSLTDPCPTASATEKEKPFCYQLPAPTGTKLPAAALLTCVAAVGSADQERRRGKSYFAELSKGAAAENRKGVVFGRTNIAPYRNYAVRFLARALRRLYEIK